jgi:hypothetical protein
MPPEYRNVLLVSDVIFVIPPIFDSIPFTFFFAVVIDGDIPTFFSEFFA